MRVQLYPKVFCKSLINKCVKIASGRGSKLEILNKDKFCLCEDDIQILTAKIKYLKQAKTFKLNIMRKLPQGKRNNSAEKECIKYIRRELWQSEKKLKILEAERLKSK